ncbi:hypothetical protein HN51_011987 [Arachis hypogaea]|uniref:3'-5' exonuclease n=1 Tax=Arachis hypogaea TaxID=3818 RepID=UPI000DECDBD9|nr:Werner Syndrome-like exonuclease [Arachis hypogaea]QHO57395.1 Werner Syndrome-like exonuclease [Arachis hypogaea]
MFGSSSSSSTIPKLGISGASTILFNPDTSKYTINFDGKAIETTVTDKANIVDQWVQEIDILYAGKSSVVVGLDVEWRPHAISYLSNKSATLQLCIDDKCLIVQLFYIDNLPLSLKNFLMNPNFTFVGIEVGDDISKLRNEYGLNCGRHADIRELAMQKWPGRFRRPGLKDLAKDLVGLNMRKPKHVSMSNWEDRVLRIEQVEYGCIDAYASYKIGHSLLN